MAESSAPKVIFTEGPFRIVYRYLAPDWQYVVEYKSGTDAMGEAQWLTHKVVNEATPKGLRGDEPTDERFLRAVLQYVRLASDAVRNGSAGL